MDCLFCKIAKKEIPAEIIYEDANTVAFLDINPKSPGHAMIIPKSHAENMIDLNAEEINPLFLGLKKVVVMLERSLKPDGFTIGINHGRKAGQVIDHLHIHVIPRFEDDRGSSIHGVVNNPPKESVKEIANKILMTND